MEQQPIIVPEVDAENKDQALGPDGDLPPQGGVGADDQAAVDLEEEDRLAYEMAEEALRHITEATRDVIRQVRADTITDHECLVRFTEMENLLSRQVTQLAFVNTNPAVTALRRAITTLMTRVTNSRIRVVESLALLESVKVPGPALAALPAVVASSSGSGQSQKGMEVISGWMTDQYMNEHSFPRLMRRYGGHVDFSTVLRWLQGIEQAVGAHAKYRESYVNHTLLMLEEATSSLWIDLLDEKKTLSPAGYGEKGPGDRYVEWSVALPFIGTRLASTEARMYPLLRVFTTFDDWRTAFPSTQGAQIPQSFVKYFKDAMALLGFSELDYVAGTHTSRLLGAWYLYQYPNPWRDCAWHQIMSACPPPASSVVSSSLVVVPAVSSSSSRRVLNPLNLRVVELLGGFSFTAVHDAMVLVYARNNSDLLPEATRGMVIPTKLRGDRMVCDSHAAEARSVLGPPTGPKQPAPTQSRRGMVPTGSSGSTTTSNPVDPMIRISNALPSYLQCQYGGHGSLKVKHCAHDCQENLASIRMVNASGWRKLFGYSPTANPSHTVVPGNASILFNAAALAKYSSLAAWETYVATF